MTIRGVQRTYICVRCGKIRGKSDCPCGGHKEDIGRQHFQVLVAKAAKKGKKNLLKELIKYRESIKKRRTYSYQGYDIWLQSLIASLKAGYWIQIEDSYMNYLKAKQQERLNQWD